MTSENQSTYVLGICELFNEKIHGFIQDNSSPTIFYHYFMRNDIPLEDFYQNFHRIKNMCNRLNIYYKNFIYFNLNIYYPNHPIQNYGKIIRSMTSFQHSYRYIKPEIIQRIILPFGGESIAIKKTIWLRLIQRTWKKIYSQQKQVLNKRKTMNSIRYRETRGQWPSYCNYYPTIRGMLHYLV